MYVAAKRELEEADPETKTKLLADISRVHRQIETRNGDVYQSWLTTRQWSLDDFAAIYQWLDVHFDVLFYESEVSEPAQAIVDEYLAQDVFKVDQGAVGVDLKPHKLGFCILRKSDGNTLYATKDLALAKRKFEDFAIDRSIYVVADEQNHHFRQVFKVLELMGFEQAKQCFHLSYGMVVLPEGKMSSRDGTAVSFNSLRQMMSEHLKAILAKYEGEWSSEQINHTAHQLCDGAIKYGMIATDPGKEIVFNLEDWLSFEGNSGPYLMYSYSRTRSILRKAAEQGLAPNLEAAASELTAASEHDLLRYLFDFNQVVISACENCKPSTLASHLFYMCKSFNRFYADVPVLRAERQELIAARLALIAAFGDTLKQGLLLLGITPPERM
jgi:arginyl-tRNA synthetase